MKKTQTPQEQYAGYSGFYLERSGVQSAHLAEELVLPPERPLDQADRAAARQFEADMLAAHVDVGVTLEDTLRLQLSEASVAPLFFAKGFIRGEVQLEDVELPHFSSPDEVYKWIASTELDKKQLTELAKKSTDVYKAHVAEALLEGKPISEETTDSRSIVLDPQDIAKKMHDLQAARAMLLDWKKSAPRGTDIADANVAYVDIFLAKVNATFAAGIPIAYHLHEQAKLTGDDRLDLLADELVSDGIARAMMQNETRQRLFHRLDFLRNGIGYNAEGKATRVSAEVETAVAEAPRGGIFTPEQMEQMKTKMLEPAQMKQIFKNILAHAELLSSEDESSYSSERKHRAPDGLFQVIINPDKATFAVDSTSGVYKVSSEPRSLYDVMIVGGFHELEHINQALADDAVGKTTKIAQIKGKRVAGLREAGANMRQRQAEEKLFGYQKPYADTYASALSVLEGGGSMGGAIKAFYDAKLRAMPDTNRTSAAREAADRVLRLVRGGINSQPMVYAEESIIVNELSHSSPEAQRRALAVTGLDLVDQARLHKFGLLELPESKSIDWSRYIMNELTRYIQEVEG